MLSTTSLLLGFVAVAAASPLAQHNGVELEQDCPGLVSSWNPNLCFEELSDTCRAELAAVEDQMESRNAEFFNFQNAECLTGPVPAANVSDRRLDCAFGLNTYSYDCLIRHELETFSCAYPISAMQGSDTIQIVLHYCLPIACSNSERAIIGEELRQEYCDGSLGLQGCDTLSAFCFARPGGAPSHVRPSLATALALVAALSSTRVL